MPLHILAVLAVIGGIYRSVTEYDYPTLRPLIMSQYLLWAILFEIGVLNIKEK